MGDPKDFLFGEWCANSLFALLISAAISWLARMATALAWISRSAAVWKDFSSPLAAASQG